VEAIMPSLQNLEAVHLCCIDPGCGATVGIDDTRFLCPTCGGLLDVQYDRNRLPPPKSLREFDSKSTSSGVWRFRELLPFAPAKYIVTIGEGRTLLQQAEAVASYVGLTTGSLYLQYEGLNPSGSFKDNGMTAAFTHARMIGAKRAACASTGNTSASLAAFCSTTGVMRGIIFIGSGRIAYGKLAQGLDHGALTIQIAGDFDDAMQRVQQVARQFGLYLVNSINPFRLEGQKTIMYRVLEGLRWEVPDWIIVPGGNLGNVSAFGKAFAELSELSLIPRLPRLAVVNAAGANSFSHMVNKLRLKWEGGRWNRGIVQQYYSELDAKKIRASTVASAIEINRPVNLPKALRALETCNGVVCEVSDEEIMDAKARVGAGGLGCEPASAASVAGARKLRERGLIGPTERVVCVLTGHALKDPMATVAYHSDDRQAFEKLLGKHGIRKATFANRPIPVANDLSEILRVIEVHS
jgi:threonine synthase